MGFGLGSLGRWLKKGANPLGIGGKFGEMTDKLTDPLGLFEGPEELGDPAAVEDPQKALARQAKNAAISGDIAVRNAQKRSSTLGAGSNFIAQQMSKEPVVPNTVATNKYNPHTNKNRLVPGAGSSFIDKQTKKDKTPSKFFNSRR